MGHPSAHNSTFYGLATVGAKGQIVIPAKARDDLGFKTGDSLVIIGIKDHTMLGVCPVSNVEQMLTQMTERLEQIRAAVNKTEAEKKND